MVELLWAFFYKYPSETFDRFLAIYSVIICGFIILISKMEFLNEVKVDTVFTVLSTLFISILVFYLGQYFDKKKRRAEVREKRSQIRELVFIDSRNLSKELKEQRDIFLEISELLDIDSSTPFPLKNYRLFSHKQISLLKYEDTFDAFRGLFSTSERRELFSRFWKDIAEIEGFLDPNANFILDFIKQSNDYQKDFEAVLSNISTKIGIIMLPMSGRLIDPEKYAKDNPDKDIRLFREFFGSIDEITQRLRDQHNPATVIKSLYIDRLLPLFNNPIFYPYYDDATIPNLLRRAESIFQNYFNFYENGKTNSKTLGEICGRLSENFENFENSFSAS